MQDTKLCKIINYANFQKIINYANLCKISHNRQTEGSDNILIEMGFGIHLAVKGKCGSKFHAQCRCYPHF